MLPSDILRELFSGQTLRQAEIDWFTRQGVPFASLAFPEVVVTDAVVFHGNRFEFSRYDEHNASTCAVIIPGYDEFGELADLVAWKPKSGELASWLGKVGLLGEEQIFSPRLGEPLVVHADPLAWLRACRDGVVIVDRRFAASILRLGGPLGVADRRQARRLREALTMPLPSIVVLDQGRSAA